MLELPTGQGLPEPDESWPSGSSEADLVHEMCCPTYFVLLCCLSMHQYQALPLRHSGNEERHDKIQESIDKVSMLTKFDPREERFGSRDQVGR